MADRSEQRRASSIHGYIGPNGAGKSLALINDTLPSLDRGRTVLSTVRLLDPETGETHPSYVKLTDWAQLLEAEHCDVLFDEVVGIASSRSTMGLPSQVANLLVQLRRRDIVLRWSAPAWARADVIIRECSQAVTDCRGFLADRSSQREAKANGTEVKAWAPKRLFRWRTFSAVDFENFTSGKRDRLSPECKEWFWGPNSRAFRAYDTLDQVSRVGEVLDSGRCVHCGGSRPVPKCRCDEGEHDHARPRARSAPRSAGGLEIGRPGLHPTAPLEAPPVPATRREARSARLTA